MPGKNAHGDEQNHKSKKFKGCCGDCCFFRKNHQESETNCANADVSSTVNKIQPGDAIVRESFCLDLPTDLEAGTCISIQAKILPECTRFAINLTTGEDCRSDIALHVNPRLAQRYVVRNCRLAGHWGKEETTSITKFNLHRNKTVDICIFFTDKDFLVSMNGRHICGYVFRIPVENVKRLVVDGAVDVLQASINKAEIYPHPTALNEPFLVPTGDGNDRPTLPQLEVPLTAHLPKGFEQGWQLEIQGHVKILPDTFFVNLQEGAQLWPHPTIPLHLNPRFSGAHGNHIFVRNSWSDGQWGQEERTTGFQFIPGTIFSLAIRRHDDFFGVWVNGRLVGEFKYRTSVDKIDTLYIQGDINLTGIYMKDHIDDLYFTKTKNDRVVSL